MKRMYRKMGIGMLWCLLIVVGLAGCEGEGGEGTGSGAEAAIDTTTPLPDSATIEDKLRRTDEKLRYSPKSWELWYERSLLWYEAGNTGRAMADIDKSIELHITNPDAYHMKGFYYYSENQDSLASRNFRKAIDMGGTNPESYYLSGQLHFFKQEYDDATRAYNEAIRLDSMQPTYYFARGFLAEARKDYDAAIAGYQEALQRNPTFVKALLALHDIYLDVKKNPDEAFVFNERIMAVDSTQPVAHFNQGNFFMARANAITEASRQPEFVVLLKVAISEYGICLRHDPNFTQSYYNRGYCLYLMEKYGSAQADFSSVIELDPFNQKAFFMLASIQEYEGDLRSALSNYRQAAKIDPGFRDAVSAVKELEVKIQKKEGE